MQDIANRIKEIRLKNNHTVMTFAGELCVSSKVIYNIEKGYTDPTNYLLIRISERFNVSTDYLLKGV